MKSNRGLVFVVWTCCFAALLVGPTAADENQPASFRVILELAGLGPEVLARVDDGPNYEQQDWQTLLQVFNRLQQFRDFKPLPLDIRLADEPRSLGEIFDLDGQIVSVEKLPLPEKLAELHNRKTVYRCQLQFTIGDNKRSATILSTQIPKSWQTKQTFREPVRTRGVLAKISQAKVPEEGQQLLLLTNHLAWYPTTGVLTGQLLLARHGMDIALLDEVVHRQAFVKPEVSREGEAFYAALLAFSKVDQQELLQLTAENITRVADQWLAKQPELQSNHQLLQEKLLAETDDRQRKILQKELKAAKLRLGIASAVFDRRQEKISSVAPLFLQPEHEVGQLVSFEGVARRAVRISATEQPDIQAYYELEVFTADSQNLPVTYCATQLPVDFPTGDEIREPVRITGAFFKSWRYRSRNLASRAGEPGHQRQRNTPVVLGKSPTWLKSATNNKNPWAFWGGVAFLVGIALLWTTMAWLARRDRLARANLRRNETINLN